MPKLKIRVHESAEESVQMKLGDAFVTITKYTNPGKKPSVWLKVAIPYTDKAGDNWDKDTFINSSSDVKDTITYLFRNVVGYALFNADTKTILHTDYSMYDFAELEKTMEKDYAGLEKIEATVKDMLSED